MAEEKEFKVGDQVFVVARLSSTLTKIVRETPKGFLVVEAFPHSLFKADGFERSSDRWLMTRLRKPDPELWHERNVRIVKNICAPQNIDKLTDEQLLEAYRLFKNFESANSKKEVS